MCTRAGQLTPINIWKRADGRWQLSATLPNPVKVSALAFNGNGTLLATGSRDGSARVWDADTGVSRGDLICQAPVLGVKFSPDDNRLPI